MAGEWICPVCGELNDATASTCVNTPTHDGEDDIAARAVAMRNAGRVLAAARARLAVVTPEQAAEQAHVPGGPSREQLAARVRQLRDQTRRAAHAA